MNKPLMMAVAALFSVAPLAALANNCEEIKADISQKIINNGVPESSFTLSTQPVGQDVSADAKVVGTCGGGQQQIIYSRVSGSAAVDAVQTPKVEDTEHPDLQPQTEPKTESQTQP